MFEFNNVFGMFKLMSVFNAFLFSLRFLGIEYFNVLALIFLIGFLFSIVINLFIAYIPYIIVLENTGVFEALGISTKITLLNIKTTLQLYIFMFFMNIKVVINFIVFLAFPLAIISIGSFLSSQVFTTIAFIIIG